MDALSGLEEGFSQEFKELLGQNPDLYEAIGALNGEEGLELGRLGAQAALAPLLWSTRVGDRWDVTRATEFLGVTRQALYKRLKNGTLLGVRGRGTTWFPTWQFDPTAGIVRAVIAGILAEFRNADAETDPLFIAAWATKANRLLEDLSPAEWVSKGRGDDAVIRAARRAASGLAA